MTTPDPNPSPATSRSGVLTLARLVVDAFEGDLRQSLMANLRGLSPEDWNALPPGAGRTIAAIVEHVSWSKWMYEDYAFGQGTLRGDQPPMVRARAQQPRSPQELLAWLAAGQKRWLASVLALENDAELDCERLTNWGESLPTRDIIRQMVGHDFYHAGEINHLRALIQGNDRWPYD